jgi:hypothetical protein
MRFVFFDSRDSHNEKLLYFESMVNRLLIFYHTKINEQASTEQARRYQAGSKARQAHSFHSPGQGMDA